jgi:hypothetical protein
MKSAKQMYDAMATEPAKPSLGHTSKKMEVADKMFEGSKLKKMAKGGVTRADGCITKGHTKGRMV